MKGNKILIIEQILSTKQAHTQEVIKSGCSLVSYFESLEMLQYLEFSSFNFLLLICY